VISSVVSVALFAWGILTGIALWRATPRGFKWAKILFALQVPVFHVARLTYEFSTGFSFRVMVGNTNRYIGGDIGSSLNFDVSPPIPGLYVWNQLRRRYRAGVFDQSIATLLRRGFLEVRSSWRRDLPFKLSYRGLGQIWKARAVISGKRRRFRVTYGAQRDFECL